METTEPQQQVITLKVDAEESVESYISDTEKDSSKTPSNSDKAVLPEPVFMVTKEGKKERPYVQDRVQAPGEIMINQLCDQLEYPEMFKSRQLPIPDLPSNATGYQRILNHVDGIVYDYKLVPREPEQPHAQTFAQSSQSYHLSEYHQT